MKLLRLMLLALIGWAIAGMLAALLLGGVHAAGQFAIAAVSGWTTLCAAEWFAFRLNCDRRDRGWTRGE